MNGDDCGVSLCTHYTATYVTIMSDAELLNTI